MNNPILIKTKLAGAAVAAHRIIKAGADDDHVIQGAAATDALLGVSGNLAATAADEPIDITFMGITEVEYGGNVTIGDELTSDANGKAVAAAPSAGVNNGVIGRAMASGVSGDIGSVHITPTQIQG